MRASFGRRLESPNSFRAVASASPCDFFITASGVCPCGFPGLCFALIRPVVIMYGTQHGRTPPLFKALNSARSRLGWPKKNLRRKGIVHWRGRSGIAHYDVL